MRRTTASLLALLTLGHAPREVIIGSAIADRANCEGSICRVPGLNVERIEGIDEETVSGAFSELKARLDLESLLLVIQGSQGIIDQSLIRAVNEAINIDEVSDVAARVHEYIASALYMVGDYEGALRRLSMARDIYAKLGLEDMANFIEGMLAVIRAEELRVRALGLHESGNHDDEGRLIEESARLYASSSVHFRRVSTVREAHVNYVLSLVDSAEVLANYHFIHGSVESARNYYDLCLERARSRGNMSGDYVEVLEIKEKLCGAFRVLCDAVISGDWRRYEESGDLFLSLVELGYVDELVSEGAVMAYGSALSLMDNGDSATLYSKYLRALMINVDVRVNSNYGGLSNLLEEVRVNGLDQVANLLEIELRILRLYLLHKALVGSAEELGLGESVAHDVLTYVAALELDDKLIGGAAFGGDVEFPGEIMDLVNKARLKLMQWLGIHYSPST